MTGQERPGPGDRCAVTVRVEGRVQGVGYRHWAVQEAAGRGLCGWVRNRRDGSVEALFIGSGESVAGMLAACRRGPAAATVTAVRQSPAEDDGSPAFRQRPTE